jgi:hypothetical protein
MKRVVFDEQDFGGGDCDDCGLRVGRVRLGATHEATIIWLL